MFRPLPPNSFLFILFSSLFPLQSAPSLNSSTIFLFIFFLSTHPSLTSSTIFFSSSLFPPQPTLIDLFHHFLVTERKFFGFDVGFGVAGVGSCWRGSVAMGLSLCLMFEFGVVVGLILGLVSLAWIGGRGAESGFEVAVGVGVGVVEVCEFDGGGLFLL